MQSGNGPPGLMKLRITGVRALTPVAFLDRLFTSGSIRKEKGRRGGLEPKKGV